MKKVLVLLPVLLLSLLAFAQIPEVENNNTFALANPINRYEVKSGTVNNTSDDYDYFRTIIPEDGTVTIFVQATCTGASGAGWLYLEGYDRRKTSATYSNYVANATSVPVGATIFDTIRIYGMAADTFYFRFRTSKVFNYQFSYLVDDITPNDAEPNGTFGTALPISINQTKVGHQEYFANGDTYDNYDYYRAVLPSDGTLKLYVEGTNQGSGNGWLYCNVYDRTKSSQVGNDYIFSASVPRGNTVSDTFTIYGMAADTVYFRFYTAGGAFSYKLRYNMTDITPNDIEPNGTFATAIPIAINQTKLGHQEYYANGDTYDNYDYYRAILPQDGTLKVYFDATNQGSFNGWLYCNVYDRTKSSQVGYDYISSASVPRGNTVSDTFTIYGLAADTVYFRFYTAGGAFSYKLRYDMTDITPNDAEPNGTIATALPISLNETKVGHQEYYANGDTYDNYDYYRAVLPLDGTLKIYAEATNQGSGNGYLYCNVYDRRQTAQIFADYVGSSSVARGTTVKDTFTIYGRAADTTYFRFYTAGDAFSYKLRYDITDTSVNDTEPNNSFATALNISGNQVRQGHIDYAFNGTTDGDDYYKTEFASNDSLKLYIQATNNSDAGATFYLYGYNTAQGNIYNRIRNSIAAGETIFDSVKIAVTAPQKIYNRVFTNGRAFSYQLSLNSRLPGNGFRITGGATACVGSRVYKASNMSAVDAGVTYHWSISGGGSLNFTDSIATINWTTPGVYTIRLYTSNANGNSVTKSLTVTVSAGAPPAAPSVTQKGRYLSIAALPVGAIRQWYKNGILLPTNDSAIYATDAGAYTATYSNDCGIGSTSPAINFNAGQAQTISLGSNADIIFSADSFRILQATATSGLPISFKIVSGPGMLRGDTLRPTGFGTLIIQALQYGNADWQQATPKNDTVLVTKGTQVITFNPIPNKIFIPTTPTFALVATATSGLPVSYVIVSGPATVSGTVLTMKGAGIVQVKARQTGNADFQAAPEVTMPLCIGLRQIEPITGPAVACVGTIRYITKKITGALYQWSLSSGGTVANHGDTAYVSWTTGGTHTLSVKANTACDTVSSTAQTFDVFVDTAFNVAAVTGMLPGDGETGLSLPLGLRWNASGKATSYDVYVWPTSQSQPLLPLDSGLVQTNYLLTENIALNQPYSWKVAARNVCSQAGTEPQQFTVTLNSASKPDLIMDTVALPITIYQGQPITVTWRVKNNGANGTGIATWKDRIYISPTNDLRASGMTLLGEYNNPSYLLPGETYTQTKTVTIPQGYSGTWYISVLTDNEEAFCFSAYCNVYGVGRYNHRENKVVESNEQNNYLWYAVPILDGALPDLQVKSIGVPAITFGGSVITATYTVKNQGEISAAGKKANGCPQRSWSDRFFISKEPIFDISKAKELARREVTFYKPGTTACTAETGPYIDYLQPDSSYTLQHQLTIPYDYFGKQYIYVFTNGFNDAFEGPFNTNNLLRSDSIQVTIAPPSDLVVSNITSIPGRNSGDQIDINYTVTNVGANEPQEAGWTDSLFVCSNPVLTPANVIMSTALGIGKPAGFIQGASYTKTVRLNIADNIPSGNFYVFVKTDARVQVFEFNQENNNTLRSNMFTITLQNPVDLVVTSIIAPDTVTVDVPFSINYTIKNIGSRSLQKAWEDKTFASDDTLQSSYGPAVASKYNSRDTLMPAAEKTYTQQVMIRKGYGFDGKNTYLKVLADSRYQVYEHNAENNNVLVSPRIWVRPNYDTIVKRSDVAIQSFTAPATANANTSINLSWTVKNQGTLTTTKTDWYDKVYLSEDTIATQFDQVLSFKTIPYANTGMKPDSQYIINTTGFIPYKNYGNWYLILKSDKNGNVVNDSASDNNKRILPLQIIPAPVPDLVVTPMNALPDSIWGGQQVMVIYKVQNNGTVATYPLNRDWYDRIYISLDVPYGYGLTTRHRTTPLNPGAFYLDTFMVTVPFYFVGPYNVIINADGGNLIFEGATGDANNSNSRPINILPYSLRPAPDLIVSRVQVPASVIVGKDLTSQFTIKNIGLNPAVGTIANTLYLSANNVFESNNDPLVAANDNGMFNLQPGDSVNTQLTGKVFPALAGLYRGLVRTNVRKTIHEEPFTNNNSKASDSLMLIDARPLTLGVALTDTILPKVSNYYKVLVPANVDLSVTLSTNLVANGSNALKLAYSRIPSELNFDIAGYNAASLNQQALVSSTQTGEYYIKVESYGLEINEPVNILVTALPFSVINTTPSVMGKGSVSGTLYGAGFKPATQIKLRNGFGTYNVGTIRKFVNSTLLEMDWNLGSVPLGIYDVVAVNPGNIETVLPAAIIVQVSSGLELEYTPLLPSVLRPSGGIFTYKGKNTGNVNIPVLQGDVTMSAQNATVTKVTTTGKAKRYTQYASQYDSLMTQDWYLSGKNKVVPFFARELAPGEEFTVSIEARFDIESISGQNNRLPIQCRMLGYSGSDLAIEQIRNFEMIRRMIVNVPNLANKLQGDTIYTAATAGSKVFIERMMKEFVDGGLLFWKDTVGLNLRWDCSRCLQNLPQQRPAILEDTFAFNPGGEFLAGTLTTSNASFEPGDIMLLEMTAGHYWPNARGAVPGHAGQEIGWDFIKVNGDLNINATKANPFVIQLSSLWRNPRTRYVDFGKMNGWSPIADTSFVIVEANNITGFDSTRFILDLNNFASSVPMRRGRFVLRLRNGIGANPDSIMLAFIAYKPKAGEAGIDGVDGNAAEPGSPGGKGGPGIAQNQKGGTGGRGGKGGNELYIFPFGFPPGDGGDGGSGGTGFGTGGDGGPGGPGGDGNAKSEGATGGIGGAGENGGDSTGGGGGLGAPGGGGGKGAPDKRGGIGGAGGPGGVATNSSYGGGGGPGGDGGAGGTGCKGGVGGEGALGGVGGAGPLGAGSDGTGGKTGKDGGSMDCTCKQILPGSNEDDKIISGAIGFGKATIAALGEIPSKGLGATVGQIVEYCDQNTSESSPGMNVLVAGGDFALAVGSGTWTVATKWAVFCLKAGDYYNQRRFGENGKLNKNYPGSSVIKNMIDIVTAVSSVPDLLAAGAKLGLTGGENIITVVFPCDPNEIKGPNGFSPVQMVSVKQTMPYTIHFENDSILADVAARKVIVRQKISTKADPLTFRVGNFNFGGHSFVVPGDKPNYVTTINLDSLGYRVNVTAGIDIVNREAFWVLQTIDANTGLPPANPFTGFLPVNDYTGKGTGFVSYSIKPLATDVTGDSITAKASIFFDENEPIETNTWVNIIDAVAPISSLSGLPATSNNPVVNITYSGQDDLGGSGIKAVDIYVADNGGTPIIFAQNFTATDTLFYGEQNHTYTFYGLATDNVGNKENLRNLGSVTITNNSCLGGVLSFTGNKNGSTYQWQVNTGSGFTNVSNDANYSGASTRVLVLNNAPGTWYGYEYRCVVNGSSNSETYTLRFATFWQGTASTAWADPANWSCGTVPNQYTDVVIPSSKVRFPDVTNSVTIRSLRAQAGAVVTVKSGASVTVLK